MARNFTRRSAAPSNCLDRNPLSHTLKLWTSMWSPLWGFAPITDTDTTTLTENIINVVVRKMRSKNPRQEEAIIEGVASYGKQLGRISDALNVVISQMDRANLKQDERRALEEFSAMYKEIATVKGKHIPPDEAQLDYLFEDIGELKGRDDEAYQNLLKKLRDFAETKLRDFAEPES
jgi:hypothetical protein